VTGLIRSLQTDDIGRVREIEDAAGEAFRGLGMVSVADDPAPAADVLAGYVRTDRGWVWTPGPAETAGAYLIADIVDSCAHIAQVSVHPDCAHRRIGGRLIEAAAAWALAHDLDALTLTTFRDVPWNAPYYWRLGFRPVPEHRLGPGLREICDDEARAGLDAWPRVVMRRELPPFAGVSPDRSDRSVPAPAGRPFVHSARPAPRPGTATN
jgi:GNAT superfamily N-acetyltransferase